MDSAIECLGATLGVSISQRRSRQLGCVTLGHPLIGCVLLAGPCVSRAQVGFNFQFVVAFLVRQARRTLTKVKYCVVNIFGVVASIVRVRSNKGTLEVELGVILIKLFSRWPRRPIGRNQLLLSSQYSRSLCQHFLYCAWGIWYREFEYRAHTPSGWLLHSLELVIVLGKPTSWLLSIRRNREGHVGLVKNLILY